MVSSTILFLVVVLSLVHSSIQQLNKQPLFSGLSSLDFSFLKASRGRTTSGGDASLCQCNGVQPHSVKTVKYRKQTMVLCMCPNAVMSADYMIDTMSKVPYAVRINDKGMISTTAGTCGGAASSGDVPYFCDANMDVTVFIHESAHSFDKGKSASAEWQNAVNADSCVPDSYSNTNYVEDFAQVVVVWVYLNGHGRAKDLGGSQFACMKNQLTLMAKYLPKLT